MQFQAVEPLSHTSTIELGTADIRHIQGCMNVGLPHRAVLLNCSIPLFHTLPRSELVAHDLFPSIRQAVGFENMEVHARARYIPYVLDSPEQCSDRAAIAQSDWFLPVWYTLSARAQFLDSRNRILSSHPLLNRVWIRDGSSEHLISTADSDKVPLTTHMTIENSAIPLLFQIGQIGERILTPGDDHDIGIGQRYLKSTSSSAKNELQSVSLRICGKSTMARVVRADADANSIYHNMSRSKSASWSKVESRRNGTTLKTEIPFGKSKDVTLIIKRLASPRG